MYLESFENILLYVYINRKQDIMMLSEDQLNDKDLISLSPMQDKYTKRELSNIVKVFHVRRIYFNDEIIPVKDVFNLRKESYSYALDGYHQIYFKKVIFLIKKSRDTAYVHMLAAFKYIVFAKINGLDIELLNLKKQKLIPAFSDSSNADNFLFRESAELIPDIENYKKLIVDFKGLKFLLKKKYKDCSVILNPYPDNVKNCNFTLKLTQDFLTYIK